ncbi:hypothetical protein QWY85_20850 [Neolewinella lacunae]|uniref:Uncharacterized protein n=1 Tax=Neolewinella lacunae TaxID=1517758 RepID=A0A923PMY2_9BACT|nr:hypothetical protein [Neolewinella lacunae]MBC6994249.1 hypothetical protein [Neolewinella lacunae]MDN3637133.1 hypothetical protein [Neolewinella lacunae]
MLLFLMVAEGLRAESVDEFQRHYSGETEWDSGLATLTITASGFLCFPGKNNPNRSKNTGEGAGYFIWNVPPEVRSIIIDSCVTVNAAFHTQAAVRIIGRDRRTSIIYGTSIRDWEDNNGTGRINDVYNYSAIQAFGGRLVVRNLSIVDPKAFCIRAFRQPAEVTGVNFIDTRGGSQNHSDGVSAGQGSLIEDCYFETGDDNVKVYAPEMVVANCTFNMVENAVPIQLGWGGYSDGASATMLNILVKGNSGRHSAGNAVIGGGQKGKGTVTLRLRHMRVDNPNASLINFRSPGQYLAGAITQSAIRVKRLYGPMPEGGDLAHSTLDIEDSEVQFLEAGEWIEDKAPVLRPITGSLVGEYALPSCFRPTAAGSVQASSEAGRR